MAGWFDYYLYKKAFFDTNHFNTGGGSSGGDGGGGVFIFIVAGLAVLGAFADKKADVPPPLPIINSLGLSPADQVPTDPPDEWEPDFQKVVEGDVSSSAGVVWLGQDYGPKDVIIVPKKLNIQICADDLTCRSLGQLTHGTRVTAVAIRASKRNNKTWFAVENGVGRVLGYVKADLQSVRPAKKQIVEARSTHGLY